MKRYTLQDSKPTFKQGERITVDMGVLGSDVGLLPGTVVGKGSEHLIDYWLVEFNYDFGPAYPFRVMSVPHIAILNF
jgi:hypothetical protein